MSSTPAATSRRSSGLAIASLVVGILALVGSIAWLGLVLGPIAAFMGSRARKRITSSNGAIGGGGAASAGVSLGVISFLVSLAWFLFFRFAIAPMFTMI